MKQLSQYWLHHRKEDWQQLEDLLNRADTRIQGLTVEEVRTLGFLHRAVTNDLSRIRSVQDHQHLEPYLNELLVRSHRHVYRTPNARWSDIAHFFLAQFPQTFRRHGLLIGLSFAVFLAGVAVSMYALALYPSLETEFLPPSLISQLDAGKLWMDDQHAMASQSSFLMQNNIRVAFNAYVFGITFGLGTLYTMFMNGVQAMGAPLQICFNHQAGWKLLRFCAAHGVIELTTIFISGGAGLLIGKSLVLPGPYTRWQALQANAKESLVLITGCVPLLVIAGIIEGMVSLNAAVSTETRITIAILSTIGLVVYLGFSGRENLGQTD